MALIKSTNPVLSEATFRRASSFSSSEAMTLNGTTNKTLLLLSLCLLSSVWTWQYMLQGMKEVMPGQYAGAGGFSSGLLMGGVIVGFILALITTFKKEWSAFTSPLYALAEGVVLGGISSIMELQYPGIVFQAILGTFGTFFFMLIAYRTKMIQATDGFKRGMMAAMGGIFFIYLISFVLNLFGVNIPYINESGIIGIGFSVFVVTIASLSLILNFDTIEMGVRMRAPKYMEWYSAFGLLVALVWLYLEILRLLAKLQNRRD